MSKQCPDTPLAKTIVPMQVIKFNAITDIKRIIITIAGKAFLLGGGLGLAGRGFGAYL